MARQRRGIYDVSLHRRGGVSRFTQPDTIIPNPADGQSYNRYSYVRNNPTNYNDPTGHDMCAAGNGGCGGVLIDDPARYSAWDWDRVLQTLEYEAILSAPCTDGCGVAGAGLVGVAGAVSEGVWDRGTTGANYAYRSTLNRLEDPAQTTFDLATGNVLLSDAHAAWAIASGAHISDENCVDEAVCFVGGLSIAEIGLNGTRTALGTTIHSGSDPMNPAAGLHEGQHVQDFQKYGAFGFLGQYLGEWATGTGYSGLYFEQRAEYAETYGRGRDFTDHAQEVIGWLWPF